MQKLDLKDAIKKRNKIEYKYESNPQMGSNHWPHGVKVYRLDHSAIHAHTMSDVFHTLSSLCKQSSYLTKYNENSRFIFLMNSMSIL